MYIGLMHIETARSTIALVGFFTEADPQFERFESPTVNPKPIHTGCIVFKELRGF